MLQAPRAKLLAGASCVEGLHAGSSGLPEQHQLRCHQQLASPGGIVAEASPAFGPAGKPGGAGGSTDGPGQSVSEKHLDAGRIEAAMSLFDKALQDLKVRGSLIILVA